MSIPFVHSSGNAKFLVAKSYYAAQLPYAGDRFAAQFIAPISGSLIDLVAQLTPADLAAIDKAPVAAEARFAAPKFTTATFTSLDQALQQLGMRAAFGVTQISSNEPGRPVRLPGRAARLPQGRRGRYRSRRGEQHQHVHLERL